MIRSCTQLVPLRQLRQTNLAVGVRGINPREQPLLTPPCPLWLVSTKGSRTGGQPTGLATRVHPVNAGNLEQPIYATYRTYLSKVDTFVSYFVIAYSLL